jgi:uncharacterized protein with HEPN domain
MPLSMPHIDLDVRETIRRNTDLPLHQAILAGNEAKALRIIRNYKPAKVHYIGHILENVQMDTTELVVDGHHITPHSVYLADKRKPIPVEQVRGRHFKNGLLTPAGVFHADYIPVTHYPGKPIAFHLGPRPHDYMMLDLFNPENIYQCNREAKQTALHLAARQGMVSVVIALLAKDVRVDLTDVYGMTALHHAAHKGHEEIIRILVQHGASIHLPDGQSHRTALELLNPTKNYRHDTLQMLYLHDPLDEAAHAPTRNALHQAIEKANLTSPYSIETVKVLARNQDTLIRSPEGKLPSSMLSSKRRSLRKLGIDAGTLLVDYVRFREQHQSLLVKSTLQLKQIPLNATREQDLLHLRLAIDALALIAKFCSTSQAIAFNKPTLLECLSNASVGIFKVSHRLKTSSYDTIPWANLELLRYCLSQDQHQTWISHYLEALTLQEVPRLHANLTQLLRQFQQPHYKYENKASHPELYLRDYALLYFMTEPLHDLLILHRLSTLLQGAQTCDHDTVAGRYALMYVVKQLGENAKFHHMTRKFSNAAKQDLPHVPWDTLIELRDTVAKYIEEPKTKHVFANMQHLLQHGNRDFFNGLKDSFAALNVAVSTAKARLTVRLQDRTALESFYRSSFEAAIVLGAEHQQSLMTDLQNVRDTMLGTYHQAIAKNETALGRIPEHKVEAMTQCKTRIVNDRSKIQEIENEYLPLAEAVVYGTLTTGLQHGIKKFMTRHESRDMITRCSNLFKQLQRSTIYPLFHDLLASLQRPPQHATSHDPATLYRQAIQLIDLLGNTLLGEATYQKIISDPLPIEMASPLANAIVEAIERYQTNLATLFAISQIVTDIYQYVALLGVPTESHDIRHVFEHNHAMYATMDGGLSRPIFNGMINVILIDIRGKLLSHPLAQNLKTLPTELAEMHIANQENYATPSVKPATSFVAKLAATEVLGARNMNVWS